MKHYQMKSCKRLLLCSSSAVRRQGRRGIICCTHRDARSSDDLQRYRIINRNTILGHFSPLKSIALSTGLLVFPAKALLIPPDTTTAAISAAGIFNDSTKPRALWLSDGPTDCEDLGNILLGPLPFISLIAFQILSHKFHHSSSIFSTSLLSGSLKT